MVQVDPIDRVTRAALASDEEFVTTLNDILRHDLRISIRELSEKSGIAQSSLYKIMHGKRCIRGMRITVDLVLNLLGNGMSEAEIIREYPDLESEDIRQCLLFAAGKKRATDWHA